MPQASWHLYVAGQASVTGTANVVMAAVLVEGTTTIYNAACEPLSAAVM